MSLTNNKNNNHNFFCTTAAHSALEPLRLIPPLGLQHHKLNHHHRHYSPNTTTFKQSHNGRQALRRPPLPDGQDPSLHLHPEQGHAHQHEPRPRDRQGGHPAHAVVLQRPDQPRRRAIRRRARQAVGHHPRHPQGHCARRAVPVHGRQAQALQGRRRHRALLRGHGRHKGPAGKVPALRRPLPALGRAVARHGAAARLDRARGRGPRRQPAALQPPH